jgi:hypothetical protein
MDNVFYYFVAIGAGLTTGIILVLLPSYWAFNKLKNRRVNKHAAY